MSVIAVLARKDTARRKQKGTAMNNTTTYPSTQPHASDAAPRGEPVMPFGKYRGSLLKDLPADYLLWLGCLPDLRQPLLGAVLREMGRRIVELDRPQAPFEGLPL